MVWRLAVDMFLLLLVSARIQDAAGFNASLYAGLPSILNFLRMDLARNTNPSSEDIEKSPSHNQINEPMDSTNELPSADFFRLFDTIPSEYVDDDEFSIDKRPRLIPRIGRRKRSVSINARDQLFEDQLVKPIDSQDLWRFVSKKAVFVPKTGMPTSIAQYSRYLPALKYKVRGTLIPRIG